MISEEISTLLDQIQSLMYGCNYEVTLGIEIFDSCFSLSDVNNLIKRTFPNSNSEIIAPVPISAEEVWEDINEKFDYRGDNLGPSLILNEKQEEELKSKQNEIKKFISKYIKEDTNIYSYRYLEGIPGDPVFWEYSFVLLNTDGICVFFYGSASD